MDFQLTENQIMIRDMVRDFATKEVLPHRSKWDDEEHFPVDALKKSGELGLLGVLVPEEYGGSGLSYLEYVTVLKELGKVCGGFTVMKSRSAHIYPNWLLVSTSVHGVLPSLTPDQMLCACNV